MNKKQGFTLIELMVVISIIAILATVGLVTYSSAQKSARDARRKDDLKQISLGLELYYQHNHYYPRNSSSAVGTYDSIDNTGDPWITELGSAYINAVPRDPVNTTPYDYTYAPFGCSSTLTNCISYMLFAKLDNVSDPLATNHGIETLQDTGGSAPGCIPNGSFVISTSPVTQDAATCP